VAAKLRVLHDGVGMRRAAITAGAVALLAVGCATAEPAGAPATADLDTSGLPACAEQPPPPPLPEVPGLTLPGEATVFSVYEVGPLTQAEGVVELTPVQVREHYEGRDGVQILRVEDERVEAEILVSDGAHRMFVKVQIACATGSNFTATVGSEADAAPVPVPTGTAAPPGDARP
jgi:hypothetical protein